MAIDLEDEIDKKAFFKCISEDIAVSGLVPNEPSSNKYKTVSGPEPSVKDLHLVMKAAKNVGTNPGAGEVKLKFL